MRIDILTLFDEMVTQVVNTSIVGRAIKSGAVDISVINIRNFAKGNYKQVDDYPYGGGKGLVMMAPVIYDAYRSTFEGDKKPYVIYMTPQGKVLKQSIVKQLIHHEHIVILCGHYEGVDQRIIDEIVDLEISIGDYVLTGGELPALVITDAIVRLLPGVLSDSECFTQESHYNGLLEHPQYTRPPEFMGRTVPEVLLSGHHKNIEKWKQEQALAVTKEKRPDMLD